MSIFGSGGGERLAEELGVPLLGQIPLYPQVLSGGDAGEPIVIAEPSSAAAAALSKTAERISSAYGRAG
jgi:ATP-binding protein involved in chromosome partitioning